MFNIFKGVLLASLLAACVITYGSSGLYVGGQLQHQLTGAEKSWDDFKQKNNLWFLTGYNFSEFVAVEVGGTYNSANGKPVECSSCGIPAVSYNYRYFTTAAFFKITVPGRFIDREGWFEKVDAYVKLGEAYSVVSAEVRRTDAGGSDFIKGRRSIFSPIYAVGLMYNVAPKVALDISYTNTLGKKNFAVDKFGQKTGKVALGVTYKF